MKQRFWLFKRGEIFYFQDSATGEQKSLGTKDSREAKRLIELKIQSSENPAFRLLLLKTCLAPEDPLLLARSWQDVMDEMSSKGKDATRARCVRAFKSDWFDGLRKRKLTETAAANFLSTLRACPPSVNHYLRRLYNLALGLGWLPFPVLPPRLWPKAEYREKRAITREEHEMILLAEKHDERNLYYQLLWETGASQSDAAQLTGAHVKRRVLSYVRAKTGSHASLVIGHSLQAILDKLPNVGPLFPTLVKTSANDRAAEFYRRCKLLSIKGISLHSYRYAWAERAKKAGYPERFAQEALGHNSTAIHRAYAKGATVDVPPLDEFEAKCSLFHGSQ
jgi:integrase